MWIRSLFVALGLAVASPAAAGVAEPGGKVALTIGNDIAVIADDFAAPPVVVAAFAGAPAWSPDGTRLAFVRRGRIEVGAADGSGATPVTDPGAGQDDEPTWTPDGSALLFRRVARKQVGLFRVGAGGGAVRRVFGARDVRDGSPRFVAGGTRMLFERDGELWAAHADGTTRRRVATGMGADELMALPDGSGWVATDRDGLVVVHPADARPLRRVAGTRGRSPLAIAPDGVRLLATVSGLDRAYGTDLVDLTGATAPRRVGGVDDRQVPVLGFHGPAGPAWWSPTPAPATTPAPDRRPPALLLRGDRAPLTVPAVRGAGARVPVVRGLLDLSLLVLDQTGVRRVRVAWVRGGARPRWRDVTAPEAFVAGIPPRRGTYRLLIRATDVLGHTTKQPREVIVKLAP
jgi:dipeptidyl aminopeptidase/acylaminoacyl peptidase